MREEVESLLAHRAAFRPGRVFNLRTGSADGPDTAPRDGRFVFGGYSPSGVPRFFDFGQLLLQLEHPRQHELYAKTPGLVPVLMPGEDLLAEVVPAFRDAPADVTIHGQVVAGWFPVLRADRTPGVVALTFQAVSTGERRAGRRRYGLNVLGAGPDGESLDELVARLDDPPWRKPLLWAQHAVESVERGHGKKKQNQIPRGGKKKQGSKTRQSSVDERLLGILGGLARRLEQARRSRDRRTGHAEQRHRQGDRPTRMALTDLGRADDDAIFVDRRHDTLIVLGERGRAHVFNDRGKLVTSIRANPDSVARKRRAEIWRPATRAEARQLRERADPSTG
ncbi:MAG: hypothetical protein AAGE94_23180 [Acidobacteriota bacterium]